MMYTLSKPVHENDRICGKTLGLTMYTRRRKKQQMKLKFVEFHTPFGSVLRQDNRWIKLAQCIPWEEFEGEYEASFNSWGNDALPFRVALGSLIIKERLGLSDRETVAQIQENPYLQYFLGMDKYSPEEPFDASLMVHFRKRISPTMLSRINERVALGKSNDNETDHHNEEPPDNEGKLIIDATCAPEDMRYPSDLSLLNDAREHTERVIDRLWHGGYREVVCRKPRTYRQRARRQFLRAIRNRHPSKRHLHRGIRQQLGYIRRNLQTIDVMKKHVSLSTLRSGSYRKLLVVAEIYRQQRLLYSQTGRPYRSIPDRIVSVSKPHVRPIVRGKASSNVEFGAKISVSVIEGMTFLDRLSWDAYNECNDLVTQARAFRRRTGRYPASIHADKIYRTRDNLRWCHKRGIRLSGPALGRPAIDESTRKELRKQQRRDERDRIEVEGKFGVAKRRYSLSRLMTRLRQSSEHAIGLVFLVMNLEKVLRDLFLSVFRLLVDGYIWFRRWLIFHHPESARSSTASGQAIAVYG